MIKKPATTEKGQSLVEMAITATLLMFLLLATIDFGIAFFYWIAIRDAAEEGAVYGSLHPDITSETDLKARVKGAASSQLVKITDLDVLPNKIEVGRTGTCPGDSVTVLVTYNYHILTPMVSTFANSDYITIKANVSNTILQPGTACPSP